MPLKKVFFIAVFALAAALSLVSCQNLDKILVGGSKGSLVAAPGMTFEEVRARSSLKTEKVTDLGDEKVMALSDAIAFDLELAGTGVRFAGCRYYALWQGKGDAGITYLNIQATKNVSWSAIKKELLKTQAMLKADGWAPDVVEGLSSEQRLKRSLTEPAPSREIAFRWTKGDLALTFAARRFPQTISGEPTDVGEPYNQELDIRKVRSTP